MLNVGERSYSQLWPQIHFTRELIYYCDNIVTVFNQSG